MATKDPQQIPHDPFGQDGPGSDDMEVDDGAQPEGNSQIGPGQDRLHDAPRPRKPKDIFPAIPPFADPYKSVFTTKLLGPPAATGVLDCLKHVNCSYLSSGVPPTLLQLKQHAQSLTVLIKEMTMSTLPALIDNAHVGRRPFHLNESFDWLNDLGNPYSTDEAHHRQPLTSILNTVDTVEISPGTTEERNICPLREIHDENPMVQIRPYATHQNLIQHANEVLERLDHEYSARGGLLSIFPTDMKKEDREKAEKTVLGQMIFWVQNLVQRIHHLERLYANAMDLLAKEAVVPTETLSSLGTRGRKGREVVYPQDKFVLVNAGDDLWEFLNAEFERKEVIDTQVDKNYRSLGATGEAIWAQRGGKEFAQGITFIDVYTRYYRLRDNPLKTIFVIPAYEIHPGTKVTREIEKQPTVVSVVKPVWPERMSVLEGKHKGDMADLKRLQQESLMSKKVNAEMERTQQLLTDQMATLKQANRELKRQAEETLRYLKEPVNQSKIANFEALGRANAARMEAATMRAHHERQIEETKAALEEAKERAEEMRKARETQAATLKAREETHKKEWDKKKKELDDYNEDIARAAQEASKLLKGVWLKQVTESQVLIQYLADKGRQTALADKEIPDHIRQQGEAIAKRKFDAVASNIPDVIPKTKKEAESPSSAKVDPSESGSEGGGGVGGGGNTISKAPSQPSWRQIRGSRGSFSTGWSEQTAGKGSPKNKTFTELGKTGQAAAPAKTSPRESLKTTSSAWSHLSSDHGSPQNQHFRDLRRSPHFRNPRSPEEDVDMDNAEQPPGSGDSKKTFAPTSPRTKRVGFSKKEMGPTGSALESWETYSGTGSQVPPNKKAKTTGKSPKLTQKGILASHRQLGEPPMATMSGGLGGGRGGRSESSSGSPVPEAPDDEEGDEDEDQNSDQA